jgi:heme exporter protein C
MGMRLRSTLFGVAVAMVAAGAWLGLAWAPPDREMGDVQRIMYAHVPAVWMALLAVTLNFGCSLAYLLRNSWKMDWIAEASAEVGVLFGAIGVTLGSIWGRPTWGVWWTWDPRLTTAAIMLVSYAGYLALRRFVEDPERRAIWSAVVAIIAYVDVPIIWFSVKWWSTLHQVQSSRETVDPQMTFVLRWNAFAFLAVLIVFVWSRYRIVRYEREQELALPEAYPSPTGGQAGTQPSGAVQ